jgi:serine/threonine protein kinase
VSGAEVPGVVDVRRVGAGGAGQVFRGRQPAFDRDVAVKVLDGRVGDETTERRFRRECRVLGSLAQHPNIVTVLDAGVTEAGRPYLVMPFLARGSLLDELERCGRLPWRQVVEWGIQLSGALHTAHLAGILHRDLKPGNVLLSEYGEPLLADFGIALDVVQQAGTTTASSITPAFCAPELLGAAASTVASDVYGLAATLWTALAGRGPFERTDGGQDSMVALLARVVTDRPADLRPLGVPGPLAGLLDAGLAKDPARRPPSALALAEGLQQVERSAGVAVTSIPVVESARSQPLASAPQAPQATRPTPPQSPPRPMPQSPPQPMPQPGPAPGLPRSVARRWVLGAGTLALGTGTVAGGAVAYNRFFPGAPSRTATAAKDAVLSWPAPTVTWTVPAKLLAPRVRVFARTRTRLVFVLAESRTLLGYSLADRTVERWASPKEAASFDVDDISAEHVFAGPTGEAYRGNLSNEQPQLMAGGYTDRVNDLCLDSGLFIAGTDGTVRYWSNASRADVRPRALSFGVEVVELSGSGVPFLAACCRDGSVRIVDVPSGAVGPAMDTPRTVVSVAYSHDRDALATVDADGSIRLWTPKTYGTFAPTHYLVVPGLKVTRVVFDPAQKRLAALGDQSWIAILDVETGKLVATVSVANTSPTAIHWVSADVQSTGSILAVLGADRTVRLWEIPNS